MLTILNKNQEPIGVLPDASDVKRRRRINSDYELSFVLPMTSDDYKKVAIKGHVMDDRGQLFVVNDRARKRDGKKRLVEFTCMHVMFKLTDFKFPYASYIEEAYGVSIETLLTSISAATGGKFTFSLDDSFDLKDIKDFGQGNTLEALNFVLDKYEAEIEPDNFVIHVRKQIGTDRGLQYRYQKNIISNNFKDSSRALTTRLFAQMKDGRTFIGLAASNLTDEEYELLNAVPGAIVDGEIRVNYLISPYAEYWANNTNDYYDNEIIDQDIEDPLELLQLTRKSLREQEVPAIDISVSAAALHRIDEEEPEAYLGDTVTLIDEEMEIDHITARVMEVTDYLFDKDKHPDVSLANFYLRDYYDIIADLNSTKKTVDSIMSGGKVRTNSFENFAAQAVYDIDNSKSQVIYDERGIVLQSLDNPLHQVVMSSGGLYVTEDGGNTAEAALTAMGLVAEKVVGTLGNFIEIEIGSGNNVFKANQTGIHLGHQDFESAPFRVDMLGRLIATQATVTGTINATGGTFSGNIDVTGKISGGVIEGATMRTASSGDYVQLTSGLATIDLWIDNAQAFQINRSGGGVLLWSPNNLGMYTHQGDTWYFRSASYFTGYTEFNAGVNFQYASVSGLTINKVTGLQAILTSLQDQINALG
ncbi:phage minor structural protein [Paenibacillus cellulosilyticus]|uniref:Phage minor structural protein n=1 Tax=Paenibacillus cellulosilyticus TaxID=375489 RepID=A0A2V2Z666_9BACL|nr:phage tail protein [Paenibacillus cellulosilyticus]PWW06340.1 phage minor structural protein [Paenibacillus cellulosilyticus]QKS43444.1 phage tail protein [Paenibacillus cellulosilyticus]QKS46308.1 phage tail protein [Paenibacillus cellulosilyticus]